MPSRVHGQLTFAGSRGKAPAPAFNISMIQTMLAAINSGNYSANSRGLAEPCLSPRLNAEAPRVALAPHLARWASGFGEVLGMVKG
mgnify:CR=1 FL=1